jgi:hypothetical protein
VREREAGRAPATMSAPSPAPTCYYELLQLTPSATTVEVRKAYRRLSLLHHPDKHGPEHAERAAATFHRLHAAYDALGDEGRRREYDGWRTRSRRHAATTAAATADAASFATPPAARVNSMWGSVAAAASPASPAPNPRGSGPGHAQAAAPLRPPAGAPFSYPRSDSGFSAHPVDGACAAAGTPMTPGEANQPVPRPDASALPEVVMVDAPLPGSDPSLPLGLLPLSLPLRPSAPMCRRNLPITQVDLDRGWKRVVVKYKQPPLPHQQGRARAQGQCILFVLVDASLRPGSRVWAPLPEGHDRVVFTVQKEEEEEGEVPAVAAGWG